MWFDIFNRVNSRGTPLTRADLALAHVCSIWPEARAELREFSARMAEQGFGVDLSFLVRCMVGVATGSVMLEGSFVRTPATELQDAWKAMQPAFEHLASVLRHEAFIGGLGDLPTVNVLVPAAIFLARQNGQFPSDAVKRRFIRWIYLAGLWARYSGASETKLQQDVAMVSGRDRDPTHELEAAIPPGARTNHPGGVRPGASAHRLRGGTSQPGSGAGTRRAGLVYGYPCL